MPELSEPALNRQERLTRDYILPALPSEFREPDGLNEKEVQIVKSVLAKQYVEHANLGVIGKTATILIAYDFLFVFQAQIYGLVLSMLGSLALALPALHTPGLCSFARRRRRDCVIAVESEETERFGIGIPPPHACYGR
jgi:hypothetical protein